MKLLMTADAVGGVWTYALELADALRPHGVEIALAVLGPPPDPARRESVRARPNLVLHVGGWRLDWMPDADADQGPAGEWLLGLAERERADLVHLNGYGHAALPWRRPCVVVAHSCVASWWQAVHGTEPPSEWDAYRRRVARGLAHAEAVVTPTRAFLERLERLYGALPRATVIHNARRAEPAAPAGPGVRAPLVLACGRLWDAAKQMTVLDAAAATLPWRVYVAGSTRDPGTGAVFAPGHVECLGELAPGELAGWYARAAIFAHPARYEPFGLAPLEAAAAGCALVLADLAELRELWDGAAEFFAPGDAAALAARVQGLIADPARRTALALAARARARRFDAGAMARRYLDVYETLLAGAARRPKDHARA